MLDNKPEFSCIDNILDSSTLFMQVQLAVHTVDSLSRVCVGPQPPHLSPSRCESSLQPPEGIHAGGGARLSSIHHVLVLLHLYLP